MPPQLPQQRGLIALTGNGRCADPYRYFLPMKMAQWQTDPMGQPMVIPPRSQK